MTDQKMPLKRREVPAEFRWRVQDVYANDEAWEADFGKCRELAKEVKTFQGTLGIGSKQLLSFLEWEDQLGRLLDRVYLYAAMKKDEDNGNAYYAGLKERVQNLAVSIEAAISWAEPEILSIPQDTLNRWLELPELSLYKRHLELITRQRPYILSEEEEKIIALTGDMSNAAKDIFTMLNNADMVFPMVKDGEGNEIRLTHGNYLLFMENHDRDVRQRAFTALYETYGKQKNTLAALMAANVKKDNFYAKVRRYPSAMEAALYNEEIPVAVYDILIDAVHRHLPDFYRYLDVRKSALAVEKLHFYDIYAPLAKESNRKISYEEALNQVKAGLVPLGEKYLADMTAGIEGGWIDVLENEGKTPGAYSSGVYGTNPYVLLNYQENLNSVFTLAHELGHSMHTFYSNATQPYVYSGYRIFVAEVASTLNETLLLRYLLGISKDKQEKITLLNYYLDQFRGTVFRQTMFAEFEKKIHEYAAEENPLSPQWLCDTYADLNRLYFGPDMVIDAEIALEWARIPHFYRAFYVYKYATGFVAASALAKGILEQGASAVERYLAFLSSGGSSDPITLLQRAGVDITKVESMDGAFAIFREMLTQLEALLA